MNKIWIYAAVTGIALLTSVALVNFGLGLATEAFRPLAETRVASQPSADLKRQSKLLFPSSPWVGRKSGQALAVADGSPLGGQDAEWVEVVNAVNMRSGGSSSDPVIKVQPAGKRLQVASRKGDWVKVLEAETKAIGWVYGSFLKRIDPESQQARLVDAEH